MPKGAAQKAIDTKNHYAYISQGRSGRLSNISPLFGINGLYTDNFTTCVILVCVGYDSCAGKASLMHVDVNSALNFDQIISELEWVGAFRNIMMFHKAQGTGVAEMLRQCIGTSLEISAQLVGNGNDNVFLYRDEQGALKLRSLGRDEKPKNIYHHPEERKLFAIRVIEHTVGRNAYLKDQSYVIKKQQIVFDGHSWLALSTQELQVDETSYLIKSQMFLFRAKSNNFYELLETVIKLNKKDKSKIEHFIILSFTVSCLEDYLNDFALDPLQTFIKNILASLTELKYIESTQSDADEQFRENLTTQLTDVKSDINTFFGLFDNYERDTPKTSYKETLIVHYKAFREHYERRLSYKSANDERLRKTLELDTEYRYAQKELSEGHDQAAYNLLTPMLCKAAYIFPNQNIYFATLYSYGHTLFKLENFQLAENILRIALDLSRNYFNDRRENAIESLIAECQAKLTTSQAPIPTATL